MKKVANTKDIGEGEAKGFVVDGFPVLIVKKDGKIYAFEDRCSHQDMPISENYEIEGQKIICMWHGAEFSLETGENLSLPAPAPIKKLNVRVDENGDIFVEID